jgi:hypothetical protein
MEFPHMATDLAVVAGQVAPEVISTSMVQVMGVLVYSLVGLAS